MLGYLVACSNSPSVTLLQVGRSPRRIKMMNCHTPFLCVHTRSEHGGGAEQHTHRPGVHGIYHRLPSLVGLALLNEAHLAWRYAVVLRQLALDFRIDVPPIARLICPQVRENELRSLLRVVFLVIFRDHLGTVARLVVGMVFIIRVYHAHVECHFPGIVRGDKHLRLFFRFRKRQPAQQGGIARLGELHQLLNEVLLLRRGRYVVQYLVLGGAVNAHILRRSVVRNLIIEGGKLRHFDEVSETLLLHHVVRHVELKIRRLLGEYRRPSVETPDILPFQLLRAQVLEQQIQFSQRVADGRAGEERSSQIFARALLYGAYGKEHVQRLLASLAVSQPRHTVVSCIESQIFELVALIYEDVVDAHLLEIHHVVRA